MGRKDPCVPYCKGAEVLYKCLEKCHKCLHDSVIKGATVESLTAAATVSATIVESQRTGTTTSATVVESMTTGTTTSATVVESMTTGTTMSMSLNIENNCTSATVIGWVIVGVLLLGIIGRFAYLKKKRSQAGGSHSEMRLLYRGNIGVSLVHSFAVHGRGVFGVALWDSRIYLIQCECNWIKVFKASGSYDPLPDIEVPEMTNPSDILVFDGHLYIPDNMSPHSCHYFGIHSDSDHCVWKIPTSEPASSAQQEKMLTSLNKWWPWTLSRTSDGRQIIISTLTDKVFFWNPEQNLHEIETVTLPHDIPTAQHIIELSCQSYLICTRSSQHKVRRLVREGNTMCVAGIPSSLDVQHPRHLARLRDGKVLVTDNISNNVLVLANDLSSPMALLRCGINGRKRPCRVAYDSSSSQLVVAFHHSAGLYSLIVDHVEAV